MRAGSVYEQRPGAASRPLPDGYQRRTPERTVLYELVSVHREPMLRHMREVDPKGYGLPRHVDRELEAFLRCGILAHGFTRVRCDTCDDELLVAFSCKHRGLCPSCTARRMADTAAHLVDRVLPAAGYRQWVFTVPKSLRLRLARDPAWASWVNRLIVRAIAVWQRREARGLGFRNVQTGAITFVQRFGGLLNLNVHYHLVVPDGVFVADSATGELSLQGLGGPTDDELLAILERVADRIAVRLADQAGHVDDAADEPPPDLWSQVQILKRNLDRVWSLPTSQARRDALFELWDECAETGSEELIAAGREARKLVVGVIRARLPAGSADAFTAADLDALNRKKQSKARFAPYQ